MPTKKVKQPLSVTHPELAKEADGWDPAEFTAGSNVRVPWICPYGHKWNAVIDNRSRRGDRCPFCINKLVLDGFNDLQSTDPEIAKMAYGWDPGTVTRGTSRKRTWKCALGHQWSAAVSSVTSGTGCPYCTNRKILPGFNDLKTLFPNIAAEADGWDPSLIGAGSHKKVKWLCASGHRFEASIVNRTRRMDRCSVCANKQLLPGFNDLATTFPEISSEADGWDPHSVFAGSNEKLTWVCKFGHKWVATPNNRSRPNSNCPICSGHTLLPGFNDLATKFPELAREAEGWDPSSVMSGSDQKRKWRCNQGHVWMAVVGSRARGINCPTCAKFGYDPNLDGYFYFMIHKTWEMLQIGITNYPKARLLTHAKLDWEVLEIRGPMDGHLTQQWETAILRMLKARGADLSNDKIAGKFDGYSEAWSKSTFEVSSIKELMRLTEEFEEKESLFNNNQMT